MGLQRTDRREHHGGRFGRLAVVLVPVVAWLGPFPGNRGVGQENGPATAEASVEAGGESVRLARDLYAHAKASIVVIRGEDRDGQSQGMGTGFVIDPRGLIATNLHVIGEGRAIEVRLADGRQVSVTQVHAIDRRLDLAILEVASPDPLPALELGTASPIGPGDRVVVIGHPQGLQHSVVQGVLSERRDIDGRSMLQIAMPVEPGNSGSPVLDAQGKVQGIVTLKSTITENLGFAGDVRDLQKLLDRPNPIPIDAWRTIGRLPASQWELLLGSNWRRRGGHITATEPGSGDGGRTLCLSNQTAPELPYEVSGWVEFSPEDGAAGLTFLSEGADRHYGFYPSNGSMRLSCFQGPTVFTWEVLHNQPHPAYRPGQSNHLRVRVSADKIVCYVNNQVAVETDDVRWPGGRAGLVKFRQTSAEFKEFRWVHLNDLSDPVMQQPADANNLASQLLAEPRPTWDALSQATDQRFTREAILDEVQRRRAEVKQLERLAEDLHVAHVCRELSGLCDGADHQIDLMRCALLISRLDNPDVSVDEYLAEYNRLADTLQSRIGPADDQDARLAALNRMLFDELGFHGSRADYYHRANSYMDRVLDDREGIPITLSILYVNLARHIGLEMVGIPLPGHFCTGIPGDSPADAKLFDPFERGRSMTVPEAAEKVRQMTGGLWDREYLQPADHRSTLVRMLRNLLNLAERDGDRSAMLRYLEAMLAIDPSLGPERGIRAVLRFEQGRKADALNDLDWLLTHNPPGVDLQRVVELRALLQDRPAPTP